ncbi:hypothetical protein PENSPDRAFT_582519 [Peniophora sp. CONT]|nr:hypothetical protein PENSPDRAFT_582519 [Peniophora sp. CONT]
MSSNVPVSTPLANYIDSEANSAGKKLRRAAPHGRIAVHKDENGPSKRVPLRSKPPSAQAGTSNIPQTGATTRAGAVKAAMRPAAAAATSKESQEDLKRKRSAFGEVVVNKPKAGTAAAGGKAGAKGKASAEEVVLKSRTTTTRTTTTTTTTARRVPPPAAAATRRPGQEPRRVTSPRRAQALRAAREDEEEQEPQPKKRRTSSVEPPAAPGHSRVQSRDDAHAHVKAQPMQLDHREHHGQHQEEEEDMELAQAELARHVAEIEAEAEADPEGEGWRDLDAEDEGDPLMVSEYVGEIFDYLKEIEKTSQANPEYMNNQKDLAWKMRGILTDWLIQVHMRFRLLPETLFLAVNVIDRFLSARVVSLAKLQLVGITCMFIAAKVEEIVSPSAHDFLRCADSSYTQLEILQAERYILKTLEWNMSYPNPIHFLRRASKADGYNVQVRTIAKYCMEIACVEWRLIAAPPSLLAAAALWLSRIMLGMENWTPDLAHYSSYPESALIPTANLMLNFILKPVRHASFYKKYASKKFMKASIFCRKWALNRWEESTAVDLSTEIMSVKALIRAARERDVKNGVEPGNIVNEELVEAQEGR